MFAFSETGRVTDALVAFGAPTFATLGDGEVLGCPRSTIPARRCDISEPGVEQLTVVMRIVRVSTIAQVKRRRSLLLPRPRRSTSMPFSINES